MRTTVNHLITSTRLIAVIRLDDLRHAVAIARALFNAGIRVQEFTLTSPDALWAIEQVLAELPEFREGAAAIGAGSVDTLTKAKEGLAAGAQFVVSPVLRPEIIEHCRKEEVSVLPGALSPTEIHTAWQAGADFVKLFPARAFGPAYLKDILAPLPELRLVPTGGIDTNNLRDFLKAGACAVGLGSSLIDSSAVAREDWQQVSHHAASFREKLEDW